MKDLAIYVHIPFCKQKCYYCDFCSFCSGEKTQETYFKLLEKEILLKAKSFEGREILSIYFGGGTPSFVDAKYIVKTLELIRECFKIKDDAEITIECNPCSTTLEKLQIYSEAGFNRISFGVQSLKEKTLKALGRLHTSKQAKEALKNAKKSGFQNISCDLMIGVPFQSEKDLINDVKTLEKLGVNHISSYMLQLEKGTILEKKVLSGEVKIATEEQTAHLYEKFVELLNKKDFSQYEVSNFAKNKTYSKHNLNYWRRGEYLGFGLAASSFVGETRFSNPTSMTKYKNKEIENFEKLSKKEIVEEIIMLGLRYFEGVNLNELRKIDNNVVKKISSSDYIKGGVLIEEEGFVKLNPKYYVVNNEIIVNLL